NEVNYVGKNGRTSLHWAASSGDIFFVVALIENKANVDITDENDQTALHCAAKNGHVEVVETLITNNAKIDATDNNGKTSLHCAAENGCITIVETLIIKNAKVDSTDSNGKTALHYAAEYGHVTIVEALIKNNANANSTDNDHCTPLFYAAKIGHKIIIHILTNNDANLEIANKRNETALDWATENKHLEAVKLLLKVQARIEKMKDFDEQHFNYIFFATTNKYKNVVKLLLEEKISENIILNYTVEYLENIKILLENGANPKYIVDKNNRTPLHWSAFEGNENMVKNLIEKHPNIVNNTDKNEETALYDAIWNGNIKIEDNIQLENFFDQLDYNRLENYSRFEPIHNTITGLVKRLQNLENLNNIDFLPFYQFFLKHIEKYMQSLDNNNNEDKEAVGCLYAWAFNKICNFKFRSEQYLIIDIKRYLDIIDNDIKLWYDASKQKIISEISNKYKKEFNAKVEEAYKIIKNQIKPEMNSINKEIDEKIKLLINETEKLIENTEKNKLTLEKKWEELKKQYILKQTLGILKIISQAMSIAGGPVGVVGDVMKGGTNIAEAFISKNNSNEPRFEISSDIKNTLNQVEDIKIVEQQLQKLSDECSKLPDKLSFVKKSLLNAKEALSNKNSIKILKSVKNELDTAQKRLEEKDQEKELYELVHNFNDRIETIEMALELYYEYQQDKEELDEINNSIKQAEDDIEKLKQYKEIIIFKTIFPMINKMQDDISKMESVIKAKSHVFLDLTKWKVQSSFKKIKHEIQKMTDGFEAQEDITHYIKKLNEGMNTIINIYDHIQDYNDQAMLSKYISDINSQKSIEIKNDELKECIEKLELTIRTNIIKDRFKKATTAFKQWVFPYAYKYLDILDDDNIDSNKIIECLRSLKSEVEGDYVSIKKDDNFLMSEKFDSITRPFFVWKAEKYKQEISKLLEGEEIILNANITESNSKKNAVKFSKIGIKFKSTDDEIQKQIDCELEHFNVKMVHSGNSYYRYCDKFYLIRSDKQGIDLTHSFKMENGKPVSSSKVYDKITEGNLMLSPYTVWKIQLIELNDKASYYKLKNYENEVDLELIGYGEYINQDGGNDSKEEVEKWYENIYKYN
ncbi:16144_t:CDS:2, partial [Gigaspora margarita]